MTSHLDGADHAPRVTSADVEAAIVSEHYFTLGEAVSASSPDRRVTYPASLDRVTVCVLTLRNGWVVTGKSACVSPALFDADVGRRLARKTAVDKIWPLLGYELACRQSGGNLA